MKTYNFLFAVLVQTLMAFAAATARAEVKPLDDEALSGVWGQSLLELKNTRYLGYDFARFTLNADLDINANLGGINAGIYLDDTPYIPGGGGMALDIGTLQLGRSDGTDAQRLVTLTNPYVELAYSNIDSDVSRRLEGMRIGFEGVAGDMGVAMTALTGAVLIDLGNNISYDSLLDIPAVPLVDIGTLRAGNALGPSRDFFVSVLSNAGLVYPSVNGLPSQAALPGIWVNWRDRLSGMLGVMPPNASK